MENPTIYRNRAILSALIFLLSVTIIAEHYQRNERTLKEDGYD